MRVQFDGIPVRHQAFSREDFFEFAAAYCAEASRRGFTLATDPNKVETLQRELLADLLRSGQIRRLR